MLTSGAVTDDPLRPLRSPDVRIGADSEQRQAELTPIGYAVRPGPERIAEQNQVLKSPSAEVVTSNGQRDLPPFDLPVMHTETVAVQECTDTQAVTDAARPKEQAPVTWSQ